MNQQVKWMRMTLSLGKKAPPPESCEACSLFRVHTFDILRVRWIRASHGLSSGSFVTATRRRCQSDVVQGSSLADVLTVQYEFCRHGTCKQRLISHSFENPTHANAASADGLPTRVAHTPRASSGS